jgi:hypothetical protein
MTQDPPDVRFSQNATSSAFMGMSERKLPFMVWVRIGNNRPKPEVQDLLTPSFSGLFESP